MMWEVFGVPAHQWDVLTTGDLYGWMIPALEQHRSRQASENRALANVTANTRR